MNKQGTKFLRQKGKELIESLHRRLLNRFKDKLTMYEMNDITVDQCTESIIEYWLPQRINSFNEAKQVFREVLPDINVDDYIDIRDQMELYDIVSEWGMLLE